MKKTQKEIEEKLVEQSKQVMDGLIAATVMQHNLIIATRNAEVFMACGVQIIIPWE